MIQHMSRKAFLATLVALTLAIVILPFSGASFSVEIIAIIASASWLLFFTLFEILDALREIKCAIYAIKDSILGDQGQAPVLASAPDVTRMSQSNRFDFCGQHRSFHSALLRTRQGSCPPRPRAS